MLYCNNKLRYTVVLEYEAKQHKQSIGPFSENI